ncbi:MAG TPA: hypothetical protein PLT64_07695 [Syntrophales bacterium]|nr:hypothetical protein [Syntrophales bacterium]HOL59731.1 hypothetical protein [Syntrophales bacterium]HPO35877.1 hypothetical protein [Syntrophales bacterium]
MLSSEAEKVKKLIEKAIEDHEITQTEYEKILAAVNADMVVDAQEKMLLAQLNELIETGVVKRVPG